MELGTLVARSLRVGAESFEVLRGSWDDVIVECELNTTPLLNWASRGSVGNLEPSHFSLWCRRTKEASAVMSVDERRWFCGRRPVEKGG
jgi:hypothetical protein